MLIDQCKKIVDEEEKQRGRVEFGEEYINESDPSVLRQVHVLAKSLKPSNTQLVNN